MIFIPMILVLGYAIYSWYFQATVVVFAKYRIMSLIWSLILIVIAYNSGYLANPDPSLTVFLAAFIMMSIVDGVGGLAEKRVIISGYFKRSIKYTDLEKITVIPIEKARNVKNIVIFTTLKQQAFYLKFNKSMEELVTLLDKATTDAVTIEIQSLN